MCLYVKSPETHLVKFRIKCYKVLLRSNQDNTLETPFKRMPINLGEIVKVKGYANIESIPQTNIFEIGEGFIHAFTSKLRAKCLQKSFSYIDIAGDDSVVIAKGYIPRGAMYIKDNGQIAATEIILKRLI